MFDRVNTPNDKLLLARHHYKDYKQQISRRVITDKALEIKNAIVEHLWHLERLQW